MIKTQDMKIPQFVLASASVARRRLLQTVGIDPIICPSDFDESQIQLNEPAELVQTLAQYMKLVSENKA